MRIQSTDSSYCTVKAIKISGTTAFVTLLIMSNTPQSKHCAFSFWIKDLDTNQYTRADNNYYWVDRCNNYNNNVRNIDINMYKEVIFEIDITNANEASMQLNHWVRHLKLTIKNANENVIGKDLWESQELELVSKEIILPTISDLKVNKVGNTLVASYTQNYESQEDFNYINDNIITKLLVTSVYTGEILEEYPINNYNISETIKVELNQNNINYSEPININLHIQNKKGEDLLVKTKFFNPEYSGINVATLSDKLTHAVSGAIKTSDGIKRIIRIK